MTFPVNPLFGFICWHPLYLLRVDLYIHQNQNRGGECINVFNLTLKYLLLVFSGVTEREGTEKI